VRGYLALCKQAAGGGGVGDIRDVADVYQSYRVGAEQLRLCRITLPPPPLPSTRRCESVSTYSVSVRPPRKRVRCDHACCKSALWPRLLGAC